MREALISSFNFDFPGSSAGKEFTYNEGDPSSILPSPRRKDRLPISVFMGIPGGSDGKESTCNVGDLGSISGLERSLGGGHSNLLQYSWRIPMDRRAQWATVNWSQRVGHN